MGDANSGAGSTPRKSLILNAFVEMCRLRNCVVRLKRNSSMCRQRTSVARTLASSRRRVASV